MRHARVVAAGAVCAAALLGFAVRPLGVRWMNHLVAQHGGTDPAGSLAETRPAQADPPAAFEPPQLDLGTHDWGEKLCAEVRLCNRSDSVMTVLKVSTGCGCLLVSDQLEGAEVAPGSAVLVRAELTLPLWTGPIEKTVTAQVQHGEDQPRYATAKLRATARGSYAIPVAAVDMGDVDLFDTEKPSQAFRFTSLGARLSGVPAIAEDWCSVSVSEDADGSADICVSVDPQKMRAGQMYATLTLLTTDARRPKHVLAIRAKRVTEIISAPPLAILTPRKEETLTFMDRAGAPVAVQTVVASDERIKTCLAAPDKLVVWIEDNDPGLSADLLVTDTSDRRCRVRVMVVPSTARKAVLESPHGDE